MAERPDPSNYDDYNNYVEDLISWKTEESLSRAGEENQKHIVEGVKEGIIEATTPPPSWTDNLDTTTKKELAEDIKNANDLIDILALGEESLKDSPKWNNPYFVKSYERKIDDFNQKNPNLIIVPAETEKMGDLEKIRPGNLVVFDLEPSVKDRVLRTAAMGYNGAANRSKNQKIWIALHESGYGHVGTGTMSYPEAKEPKKPDQTDPWGSQKEFERWRVANGAKPR